MKRNTSIKKQMIVLGVILLGSLISSAAVYAHCDTLDGPVVKDAKTALEKKDITPVLKWVMKDNEQEIRSAFEKTIKVRAQGKDAQELADTYFFETLVRVHRAGEGAPYTGLKPAGEVEPIIAGSDKAIDTGSVDNLAKMVSSEVEKGIRERFAEVAEKKKHADDSVEDGREYVESYVTFIHYVERIQMDTEAAVEHGEHQEESDAHHE